MRVSIARITSLSFVVVLMGGIAFANPAWQSAGETGFARRAEAHAADPAQVFRSGETALKDGKLDDAERDFRLVLQLDPQAGAAYANLGVVYMRRKEWNKALQNLQRAEHLMPQVPGIRLNIGLAYFRQNEFLKAIPAFESVVRNQPDALQPRYLLGLCYFFGERWADAANTLEPLWAQESGQFPYLYVLANAANRAGKRELDARASEQLIKVGNGSPEYHLFAGKYYLNREQYDQALTEFQATADADPRFPFVHFNLGFAHLKRQEYAQARDEFLKDAAVEPDLALNYEELGDTYWLMEDDAKAEKSYLEALERDPRLVNSDLGLAKIYQRQQKFPQALAKADAAVKLDPDRPDVHYVRGQVLLKLGRQAEAKKELQLAANSERRENEKAGGTVPSPELMQDAQ